MSTIRERDAAAGRCTVCHETRGGLNDYRHEVTAEECDARLMKDSHGRRGCWDQELHHGYVPGPPVDQGDIDRRALRVAGDVLAETLREQHPVTPMHSEPTVLVWCEGCDAPESECWAIPALAAWNEATG